MKSGLLAFFEPVAMGHRGGVFRARYLYMLLGALLVILAPARLVDAQRMPPAFKAHCTVLGPVTLPAPGAIPVVVTYMKNSNHAGDDVESKTVGRVIPGGSAKVLSRDRIGRAFESNGEFQRVWGPLGIRFALVGFRECDYTLGPSQDNLSDPRHDIPNPDVTLESVFLKVLDELNTTVVQTDSGEMAFRGLNLYLWWLIEGGSAGYGIRPRFGKINEESGLDDESAVGRPGAVWLDTRCVGGTVMAPIDFCVGLFSHEVGHFLGLCHCCLRADVSEAAQRCRNYLKPRYCPGLRISPEGGPACDGELDKRLMSATNPFTVEENFGVEPCEKETALKGKEKLLRFGGNGIRRR